MGKHEDAVVWWTMSHQEALFEVVDVFSSLARCYSLVDLQTYLEQDGCFDTWGTKHFNTTSMFYHGISRNLDIRGHDHSFVHCRLNADLQLSHLGFISCG